jgi:hypothetical protein
MGLVNRVTVVAATRPVVRPVILRVSMLSGGTSADLVTATDQTPQGMNPIRAALRILASPCGTGEPATGDGSGAFDANVVATLKHLAEMINQE